MKEANDPKLGAIALTAGKEAVSWEDWLKPGRFALILGALIIAFFPGLIFAGKSMVFRDFGLLTMPGAYFLRESIWNGELPLWNPYNNCGMPFLAEWNTACLYPLSLIYVVLPLVWGLNVSQLLHLFIAGMGMYALVTHWTQNRFAAAVAGVAFAFSGMTLSCLMWVSNVAALAWMPWVVLFFDRAVQRGGRQIILAALLGALQMLAGAPETIALTWLISFALLIVECLHPGKLWFRFGRRFAAAIALTTLLSAAQLLPFLNLLAHSQRMGSVQTSAWAIPSWGWANLFLPLFHCYQAPLGVYFQPGQELISSYYLGLGILALAVLAPLVIPATRVWMLAFLAAFGFALAFGTEGFLYAPLLKIFPPLGVMRYPVKFAALTVFCVPVLAAFSIAQICKPGTKSLTKMPGLPIAAAFLSVLAVVALLWHAHDHPFAGEQWPVLLQNGLLRIVFFLVLFAGVLSYARIRNTRLRVLAGVLMLIVVWLDLITHTPRQNPEAAASVFDPGIMAQRFNPAPKAGEARILLTQQRHDFLYGRELTDPTQDFIGRRCALPSDCNILDHIATPDGFYPLYVREQRELFMSLFHAPTNAFPGPLADFLSVGFVPDPQDVLGWQPRPTHLPCYSLGAKPQFVALSDMPARLLATNFNPREVVYLPPETQGPLAGARPATGSVHVTRWENQHIEFEVESSAPAMLTLSQTYYDGWHALVNQQPATLWRANYAFQGIGVPAGRSTVVLSYQDQSLRIGLILSGVGMLICLLGWWWFSARKKMEVR